MYLSGHNATLLSPQREGVDRQGEGNILSPRLNLLLFLIADMGSIRQAAIHTGLSYQKAWDMINTIEDGTGYKVVERRRDGKEEEGQASPKREKP